MRLKKAVCLKKNHPTACLDTLKRHKHQQTPVQTPLHTPKKSSNQTNHTVDKTPTNTCPNTHNRKTNYLPIYLVDLNEQNPPSIKYYLKKAPQN
tara:strand:- start:8284 stop:8565 length:282 start_codon:yes stop_codon:yes gene_type:complete